MARCARLPLSGCAGLPPQAGQNKTQRNTLFINGSTVSTGYSATACGGKEVAPATKGGMHFLARRAVVWFSDGRSPVVRFSPPKAAFILAPPWAPSLASAAVLHTSRGRSPQPACKARPITGRTLGAQGRQARRRHQPSPAGRQPSGIQVSAAPHKSPSSQMSHTAKKH